MSMATREATNDLVAQELRAEIGRQRLSERELARRMDVPQSWLNKRLTGIIPLRIGEVIEIADLLKMPLEQLFDATKQAGKLAAQRALEFAVLSPSATFRRLAFRYAGA